MTLNLAEMSVAKSRPSVPYAANFYRYNQFKIIPLGSSFCTRNLPTEIFGNIRCLILVKNWENSTKWPTSRKSARVTRWALACAIACQFACALAGDTTAARANHARAWGRGP